MSVLIKGKCEATLQLKKLVEMVAQSNSTVLLRGETGCGKDVVARAIHESSKRNGDLINVNCAAIPSELLESELFGHEKGAFTGADSKREGRFEASNNGILFSFRIFLIRISFFIVSCFSEPSLLIVTVLSVDSFFPQTIIIGTFAKECSLIL